jgi:37-kD nucleoid-associated bacterial protein
VNLGTFFIESLIVHDVPRRSAGDSNHAIVFSDVAANVDQGLKNFFRERTIRSLNRQAYEVERDPNQSSPVPTHVIDIAGDPQKLVARSQEVARHLWSCQTAVNPAGLLILSLGTVDDSPAVSILKLEREDAIRVEPVGEEGARTFNIAHLRDLMLGKNTKLFKASLFTVQGDQISGLVSDDQRGYDPQSEIAQFFLRRFLGCRLKLADDVSTKAFFEVSQEWINRHVQDDAKKARYEVALLARMNSPTKTITVKSFADDSLDTEDRTPYRAHMIEHGLPTTSITKNTQLIEPRIRQLTYATREGIRVSGTHEKMDELVEVKPDEPGGPVIQVRDGLKDVRGGR